MRSCVRTIVAGLACVGLWAAPASTPPAQAEISAFFSRASPAENWKTGLGAALGSTWFRLLILEAEVARQPADLGTDDGMTSFTASALVSLPTGQLRPYGGLGVGLFRQSVASNSDTGTLKAFVVGLKLRFELISLKAEYRRLTLSGTPLLPLTHRVSVGLGF